MMSPRPSESAVSLAFETSSLFGSVALGRGTQLVEARPFSGPRRHAVEFLPTVAELCRTHGVAPADVRCVFVSIGPGSFTGLRIGVTAARAIALASGVRTVAVPTLEVIAQNATDAADPPERVAVLLDAKRRRVYAATFARKQGGYQPEMEPVEADPERFLADQGTACAVLGDGVDQHRAVVEASGLRVLPDGLNTPRSQTVFRLGFARAERGQFTEARSLTPTYIRLPEAEERWAEKQQDKGP